MSDAQQQSFLSAADFILKMPISAGSFGSADKTKLQEALIEDLPAMFAGKGTEQVNKECDVLKRLITTGDRLFASDAGVRDQAIKSFAQMASNDSTSQAFLLNIICGAGADPSPVVRLAALNALQKFHPDDIDYFCLELLTHEKDAEVLKAAASRMCIASSWNSPEYRKQFDIAKRNDRFGFAGSFGCSRPNRSALSAAGWSKLAQAAD